MAGRNVNITTSGWRLTGTNVSVPQREMTIHIEWVDADGAPQTYDRLIRFPNDLALLPAAWLTEALEDLIVRAARRHAGVDE